MDIGTLVTPVTLPEAVVEHAVGASGLGDFPIAVGCCSYSNAPVDETAGMELTNRFVSPFTSTCRRTQK